MANRVKWRKELNCSKEAEEAYAFFQWCDRFSLILCNRELPAGQRALEISKGSDGKRYDVMETSDGDVCVKP